MYYINNGDGSYTYYEKRKRGGYIQTIAIIVYCLCDIPEGYTEGIFKIEDSI